MQDKRGRGRPRKNPEQEPTKSSNVRLGTGIMQAPYPKKDVTYHYTQLAKTALGGTELYNLYGIVIDATYPHPKKNFYR
jgi:hypothetical protein